MTTADPAPAAWPGVPLARTCLVMDFDGTLAPIVPDPADSALPAATAEVLVRLAPVLGRVAMVSGRPASFLADRVAAAGLARAGIELVGLYGLERVVDGLVVPDARVAVHLPELERARGALQEAVSRWPGAALEDKGRALAVHWRRAEDGAGAAVALVQAVREVAGGLQVEDGKMVVELRPPVSADKGTAVRALAEGFGAVAYCGDDLGDLPAFAEVQALAGLAVVVDHGAETDPRVRAAADLVVDGTDGLLAWLEALADLADPSADPAS